MAPKLSCRYSVFSQRGTGKSQNEDAVLLDGQVHQGRVREHGDVDASLPRYFAVADGVAIGTHPRAASRSLLELLQARLSLAPTNASMSVLLHLVRQDYVGLSAKPGLEGMASTLVGVRLIDNTATIFNVGDSRAYLLTSGPSGPQARLLTRDHSILNDMIDDGELTSEQSEDASSFMRGLTSQFVADLEYDEFKVNVVSHQWLPGERLLLCSDGLNEVLSDVQIGQLLVGNSDEDLLNACKASRRAGGTDDFSVIVLELHD